VITLRLAATLVAFCFVQIAVGKPFNIATCSWICLVALISQVVGAYTPFFDSGFGAAVWCIFFGMLIRLLAKTKLHGTPSLTFAIMVSIGLLAVDLSSVGQVGLGALAVAWLETTLVLVSVYYFGKHCMAMDDTQALLTSAGLSVCGSSAVAAVGEVLGADDKLMSALIALMSILTIPLIVLLPLVGEAINLNNSTLGAWQGGSIDSTGAVVASASLVNSDVLKVAVIVKMLQNVIIGPVVMATTIVRSKSCKFKTLWDKFPKFVLSFLVVGCITTLVPEEFGMRMAADSFVSSEWFSCVSFVMIGYEINLLSFKSEFCAYSKVLGLYVIGQFAVDTFTTLAVAYLVFGDYLTTNRNVSA
jgi:uncharacterized membrane protein YadS